ncbi:MAG: RES family NAD+ phosphorylase [Alphaproteobacteria bacterium]|nr:RES family NAD+ phosphorylase [Alphaproteobacteria bacterium]
MTGLAKTSVPAPTYRLVPSRFPPVSLFGTVASAGDLDAVMELEGWTNDRLVRQRLARLPRDEWVFGRSNASVVMASFLHAAPAGLRFTSADLGGWYAALNVKTAVAEVAHHLRREAVNTGQSEMCLDYRSYVANVKGDLVDIRKGSSSWYDPASYAQSQAFGEAMRAAGETGLVYDSVRHVGGTNVVIFRPTAIVDVCQGAHYELRVPVSGTITVRTLSSAS